MAFNPQIINPLDFEESVAIGIDIPFNGNAVFKSNFQTKNAIKNNKPSIRWVFIVAETRYEPATSRL